MSDGKRCPEKTRYLTQKRALKARQKILAKGAADYLRSYECPHCGGWHLTSRGRRVTTTTTTTTTTGGSMPDRLQQARESESRPIVALIAVEFTDPEGIDVRGLDRTDEIDQGVADMLADDAAELIENHWRVKTSVLRGWNRVEALARQILDETYPADIFGSADNPDSDASDPGVRLVRALRACEAARRDA